MGVNSKKLDHVYYGPEYSDEEIEHILKEAKVKYEKISDPAGEAAELIAKDKIIGWFQGRMEAGPRALGNRSILANPSKAEMVDKINYFVKHREPWRPFCPSMLDKAKKRYMKKPYASPFMILAFNTTEKAHDEIPAVLHKADKSMRPQTVTKDANPLYYKLIREFEKITGIPVVLNTSFNVAGEPIVCSPKDALGTFFKSGMDYLVMGNYLVRK